MSDQPEPPSQPPTPPRPQPLTHPGYGPEELRAACLATRQRREQIHSLLSARVPMGRIMALLAKDGVTTRVVAGDISRVMRQWAKASGDLHPLIAQWRLEFFKGCFEIFRQAMVFAADPDRQARRDGLRVAVWIQNTLGHALGLLGRGRAAGGGGAEDDVGGQLSLLDLVRSAEERGDLDDAVLAGDSEASPGAATPPSQGGTSEDGHGQTTGGPA